MAPTEHVPVVLILFFQEILYSLRSTDDPGAEIYLDCKISV